MRLCKFHFSMAMAIINPPIVRKTNLCPKDAVVSANSIPPVRGNRIIGNKAVTEMGRASVIHQIAIQMIEAKTPFEAAFRSAGLKNRRIRKNTVGPK